MLAGLAIGSLIFKPQLGLAAAVVFVCALEWKVVWSALVAASLQLAAAWIHYGAAVMSAYFHALANIESMLLLLEPRPYQTHSLRSFWSMLIPWPRVALALYVISALGALVLAVQCWKGKASLEIHYAALVAASVLVSPHLTVYDLVILAPAFLLLGDWSVAHRERLLALRVRELLYLCYPLFMIGPLAQVTHLQLSVVAMTALLWLCWRISAGSLSTTSTPLAVSP
jgi:hypothetical protein